MKKTMIATVLALLAFAGCRQKDVRDFTIDVPALSQESEGTVTNAIRSALAGCCGVEMSSVVFDSANHCVKLRYDSMQTAKKNIEFALAEAGFQANDVKPSDVSHVTKSKPDAR